MKYVEGLEAVEDGDRECVDNRLLLEKAWQVVANEFYDCKGRFSQAAWAGELLQTLQASMTASHMGPSSMRQFLPGVKRMCMQPNDSCTNTSVLQDSLSECLAYRMRAAACTPGYRRTQP